MAIIFGGDLNDFEGVDLREILKKLGLPPEIGEEANKVVKQASERGKEERRHAARLKAKLQNMKPLGLGAEFDPDGLRFAWKGESPDPEIQVFMLTVLMYLQAFELSRSLKKQKMSDEDVRALVYSAHVRAHESAIIIDQENR